MAVYKATYCYPFLDSIDIRVAVDSSELQPCKWLSCRIDSSNKKIIGYKIRILDSANNQVFPSANSNDGKGYISTVEELQIGGLSDSSTNTGLNGSVLRIPFFQNLYYSESDDNQMKLPSLNAVYYAPRYKADYMFRTVPQVACVAEDADTLLISRRIGAYPWAIGETILMPFETETEGITCDMGIFEVIAKEGRNIQLKRCTNADSSSLDHQEILITRGDEHDVRYFYDGTDFVELDPGVSEVANGIWTDIEGNVIDFNIQGGSYKWEITLYQGETTETTVGHITITWPSGYERSVYYIEDFDPSNEFKFYDIVLNSGKILGSTNKRIQIASSRDDDGILPIGTVNSPLVLQGTYVQLLDSNRKQLGNRAYVQNYDSSFGHIYPIANSFVKENIEAADQVCFYKHSNNAEEVLAKERVICATTEDISIYDAQGNPNPNLGLITVDGVELQEGQAVLVKDQVLQYENGVYIAHKTGTAWTRSGSYNNWGSFIGAVIFVDQGDVNGATNWESTAGAGGSLYTTDSTSGQTPLIFIPETPITLFIEKDFHSINLIREYMPHEMTLDPNYEEEIVEHTGDHYVVRVCIWQTQPLPPYVHTEKYEADGVRFSVGDRIYCYDSHKVIEITSIEPYFSQVFTRFVLDIGYNIVETIDTDEYLNVSSGEVYGGHICKVLSSSVVIADDAKYAYILKNTVNYTYISPYIGLREDMALKLLNNQKVTYADTHSSEWIKAHSDDPQLKAVNITTWRIAHEELAEPLASESQSNNLIPFAYEVRSFYRVSDENPFFTYEDPYLTIQRVDPAEDFEPVATRYVTYSATYEQFQQLSWESYRWVLLDSNNNVVQDTGLKYDGDMNVTFYGLSNEPEHNIYKAVLYVTDNLNNKLTSEVTIEIAEATTSFSTDFKAEFDCSTHSMLLTNQFDPQDDTEYSIYRREYQLYRKTVRGSGSTPTVQIIPYQGEWQPVILKTRLAAIRDFNIVAGRSYQYIIYPAVAELTQQQFANAIATGHYAGSAVPIETHWDEWSLIELKPVETPVDAPIVRKAYEVDLDNIWLFKYGLETGNQNQNFQKSEIQTLGKYQKIGYGQSNFISGDVSCYLGSEIVPYSKNGYIERMRGGIAAPLSTNEKIFMLEQWRKIASSPNPKLLKDIKGQSWIVQIMSNNNTPKNFYSNQPDTISFSWKQIDDTDGVIIVGNGRDLPDVGSCNIIWEKIK